MKEPAQGTSQVSFLLAALCLIAGALALAGCQAAPAQTETGPAQVATTTPEITTPTAAASENDVNQLTGIPLRTAAEATAEFDGLGPQPTAEQLATVIADIDTWFTAPDEQDSLRALQNSQIARLRELVKKEVEAQQARARTASTGKVADDALEKAAQSLALYPMSDEAAVIAEARRLSSRQLDTAAAVESSRRQRYNSAAIDRIESAINYLKENPLAARNVKNTRMIDPIADWLGPIDPFLLEPVVLDLYTLVLKQMNDNLDLDDQFEFARALASPARRRKTLRDF